VWSLPGDDIIYDHPVLGPGEGLLSGDHLNAAFSCRAREKKYDAHLVRDYSKRVDVTLFRRVAVPQLEAGRVQQLRCHVSDGAD